VITFQLTFSDEYRQEGVRVRVRAGSNSGTEFRDIVETELDGILGIPSNSGISGIASNSGTNGIPHMMRYTSFQETQ